MKKTVLIVLTGKRISENGVQSINYLIKHKTPDSSRDTLKVLESNIQSLIQKVSSNN